MIKNKVASKNAGPSLPNSQAVQEALIGALLQNGKPLIDEFGPARIAGAITSAGLLPIFHAIALLYDERSPIGTETVIDVLRREGKLEATGGEAAVRKLWIDGNGDSDIFGYHLKQAFETNAQYEFTRQVSHFHSQVMNGEITIGSAPPVVEKITKTCHQKEASCLLLCAVKDISTLTVPKGAKLLDNNLLSKTAELVLAGMMGLGKSRLLFQLALACAAGCGWCGFETFAKGLRWLILQTENNNERLRTDIEPMLNIFGRELPVFVQSITSFEDKIASLDDPGSVTRIQRAIREVQPDIIAFDPYADYHVGDPNSDADVRKTFRVMNQIVRQDNPDRAMVILHHGLTGKAGILKASGYERSGFGRGSKEITRIVRGQINIVPGDAHDPGVLVFECGKCSNGPRFIRRAVRLDVNTMTYQVDDGFDWDKWDSEIGNQKKDAASHHPEAVLELVRTGPLTSDQIVEKIKDRFGLDGDSVPRDLITRAKARGLIKKTGKVYVPARCQLRGPQHRRD